jgi:hypothetical protein
MLVTVLTFLGVLITLIACLRRRSKNEKPPEENGTEVVGGRCRNNGVPQQAQVGGKESEGLGFDCLGHKRGGSGSRQTYAPEERWI